MDGENKFICHSCVSEPVLFKLIKSNGRRHKCNYCERTIKCYSITQLSEHIDNVIETFFERTSDYPDEYESRLMDDRESDYFFERHGENILELIADLAEIPQKAAEDIQSLLADKYYSRSSEEIHEETEYAIESHYELRSLSFGDWQHDWTLFENSLKFESRFFNRAGSDVLLNIFEGIGRLSTHDRRPLVVEAGPGQSISSLFRARVFHKVNDVNNAISYPEKEIGPPPPRFAASGRMNAAGISTFYGATNPHVSISEVRPPVGSYVVVACFDITRKIRLLDLTALTNVASLGSYFDADYKSQIEKANFLRHLSTKMTLPVMPDDTAFDYLPTQAIADFLSNETQLGIDGIIFPSAQTVGNDVNVVLFNKASRVKEIKYPEGTIIESTTEQETDLGIEPNFEVIVWTQSSQAKKTNTEKNKDQISELDNRLITLEVNSKSVKVHRITSVSFKTDENYVARYEIEKKELPGATKTNALDW